MTARKPKRKAREWVAYYSGCTNRGDQFRFIVRGCDDHPIRVREIVLPRKKKVGKK